LAAPGRIRGNNNKLNLQSGGKRWLTHTGKKWPIHTHHRMFAVEVRFRWDQRTFRLLIRPELRKLFRTVPYGRERLRFQLRHPEDTPLRCRSRRTPHHRRERPIHLRPVATAQRGPIPRSSFSSSREIAGCGTGPTRADFICTIMAAKIPGVNMCDDLNPTKRDREVPDPGAAGNIPQ